MIHKTAERTVFEVLRLLGRPRFFEINPGAPSVRNAFNNRHTWRSLRPRSCAAVRTGSPSRSTSRSTSSRLSSASLMLRTVTDIAPAVRKTIGETDISKLDSTDICTLPLHYMSCQSRISRITVNFLKHSRSRNLNRYVLFAPPRGYSWRHGGRSPDNYLPPMSPRKIPSEGVIAVLKGQLECEVRELESWGRVPSRRSALWPASTSSYSCAARAQYAACDRPAVDLGGAVVDAE